MPEFKKPKYKQFHLGWIGHYLWYMRLHKDKDCNLLLRKSRNLGCSAIKQFLYIQEKKVLYNLLPHWEVVSESGVVNISTPRKQFY